jgi:hypothetical protein
VGPIRCTVGFLQKEAISQKAPLFHKKPRFCNRRGGPTIEFVAVFEMRCLNQSTSYVFPSLSFLQSQKRSQRCGAEKLDAEKVPRLMIGLIGISLKRRLASNELKYELLTAFRFCTRRVTRTFSLLIYAQLSHTYAHRSVCRKKNPVYPSCEMYKVCLMALVRVT